MPTRSDQIIDFGDIKTEGKQRRHGIAFSTYMVLLASGFGVLLILLNVYQLYHLSWISFGDAPFFNISPKKKMVWVYAENVCNSDVFIFMLIL